MFPTENSRRAHPINENKANGAWKYDTLPCAVLILKQKNKARDGRCYSKAIKREWEELFMDARIVRCCDHCGVELEDDALFCPTCGYPVDLWPEEKKQKSKTAGTKKKSWVKKGTGTVTGWKRTAITITAIVLLLSLAGTLASSYFAVLGGPFQQMTAAINHTIRAESFTVDTTIEYAYFNRFLYNSAYVQYNLKNEELLLWMTSTDRNGDDDTYAVCDGYLAEQWDNGAYDTENVQRDINFLFDMYRESAKLSFRKTDWQSVLDGIERGLYREIARKVDMEQAEKDL